MGKINKVILDTNILQYGVSNDLNTEVASLLKKVSAEGYGLVISGFSIFEVYRGLKKDKVPVTKALVNAITSLEVDEYTFRIAAVLYTCYKNHDSTRDKNKWNDDGDVVIGANAIRYETAILTANGNDYPRPFFTEISKYTIKRRKDKAEIVVHLLKPDVDVFNTTMHACFS